MPNDSANKPLSYREVKILTMLASGQSDVEIAAVLGTTKEVVASILSRMLLNHRLTSRVQLIQKSRQILDVHYKQAIVADNGSLVEMLNEKLKRNLGEFHDELFEAAAGASTDMYIVIDSTGAIRWINATTVKVLGYQESELVGQHISILVEPDFHASHRKLVTEFFKAPARQIMSDHKSTFAVHKDGRLVEIYAVVSDFATSSGTFASCIARPAP